MLRGILDWIVGRRWTPVATARCRTNFTDTGKVSVHILALVRSNDGRRQVRLLFTGDSYGCWREHPYVVELRVVWEVHGKIPDTAQLVED